MTTLLICAALICGGGDKHHKACPDCQPPAASARTCPAGGCPCQGDCGQGNCCQGNCCNGDCRQHGKQPRQRHHRHHR